MTILMMESRTEADVVPTPSTIEASAGQFAPWHSGVSATHYNTAAF